MTGYRATGWRVCSGVAALVLLLLGAAPVRAAIFTDIQGLPMQRAIERLAARGIIRGTGDKFNPTGTVTRAELAVLLVRAFGFDTQGLTMPAFKDAAEITRDQQPAVAAVTSLASVSSDKVQVRKGALVYTLTTNKKVYAPGEPVLMKFTVENTGKEMVKFEFASNLHFDFIIKGPDGAEVAKASIGTPIQREDQTVQLAPDGKFEFAKFWKQIDQNDDPVPPGRYEVIAIHNTKSNPTTVSIILNKGIMAGFADNMFRPKQEVTRLEMATVAARALGLLDTAPGSLDISDASAVPQEVRGLVAAALDRRLIATVGNREFRPAQKATRAELAQALDTIMDTLKRYNFSKGTLKDPVTGTPPQITLEDERKALRTYRVARNHAVYRNDRPAELRDLRPGDTILFLNVGDVGDVAYIEATGR